MIPDAAQLNQVIDQLAMNIISMESEDIMALGTLLQQIEEMEKLTEGPALQPIQGFCFPFKKMIENPLSLVI